MRVTFFSWKNPKLIFSDRFVNKEHVIILNVFQFYVNHKVIENYIR